MSEPRPNQERVNRRRWLCIAYAFPPILRSGTHRTLGFVRHLHDLGWDATVLTVDPSKESLDESLLENVPVSTRIVRTACRDPIHCAKFWLPGRESLRPNLDAPNEATPTCVTQETPRSIKDWLSRMLITPDSRTGWIPCAVQAGLRKIRRQRPNVLYSTSPCMSAHIVAWILTKLTRIPWTADFRDPWRGNPFRDLRYRSVDRWDAFLERRVLHAAAHLVVNTPAAKKLLIDRVPFAAAKCSMIPNGFDRDCLAGVAPKRSARTDQFVLTHCGQFYGPRTPKVWLQAIRAAIDASPQLKHKLRIVFVGSPDCDGRSLKHWAEREGVAGNVIVAGEKSHAVALSYSAGSDAVVLAGSVTDKAKRPAERGCDPADLQVPAKLFEYLALRRPILANFSPNGSVAQIVREAKAQAILCEPGDVAGLARGMESLACGVPFPSSADWSGVMRFERPRQAEALANIFQRLTADRRTQVATRTHSTSGRTVSLPISTSAQPGGAS
jgi:glycosyltransferase involved in cell wall biosynthesis